MLNVAVTGNAAAGKSAVVKLFRDWGAAVVDADEIVREVQAPGSPILTAIARRFGHQFILADGSLDRVALRGKVMGDDDALASLNAIVHPAVRRRRTELAAEAEARGDQVLVNEIPLLFEVMNPEDFDLVVLVDAPIEVRRARLTQHRELSERDADRLIAAQLPSEHKRERSHIIIDNTGTLGELEKKARDAWAVIMKKAEQRRSPSA
ncbi:MAG: dephospho-CoA kinase [Gemmatimonadetes bacterium]|nr:dephospho-CoA kinase [Gemmatimonadota bacterium]